MARSRNIKPGLFKNDILAELPPLARLLFIGLWCVADREGRLEDRVKRIKAEVLPYDNCNVDDLLNKLHESGFIVRYTVEGNQYIEITNFVKHQNPHVKEQASDIPAPDLHQTCTELAPDLHGSCPADSLNPLTDSLIPHTSNANRVLESWNSLFDTNLRITKERAKQISTRLKTYEIDDLLRAVENLSKSKFHRGENERGWKATPEWLFKSDSKVDEWLNYEPKHGGGKDGFISGGATGFRRG